MQSKPPKNPEAKILGVVWDTVECDLNFSLVPVITFVGWRVNPKALLHRHQYDFFLYYGLIDTITNRAKLSCKCSWKIMFYGPLTFPRASWRLEHVVPWSSSILITSRATALVQQNQGREAIYWPTCFEICKSSSLWFRTLGLSIQQKATFRYSPADIKGLSRGT